MALAKIISAELIGEGRQLVEILRKKYRVSKMGLIKRYAKKMGIGVATVEVYFSQGIIQNEKFIKVIEEDLGKPYNQIVEPLMDQLFRKIESIRDNLYLYNVGTDITLLEDLIEHCDKYKQPYYEVIAMGNLARFRANLSLFKEARQQLKETIKLATKRGYKDLVVFYYVNLAYVENTVNLFPEARKALTTAEMIMEGQQDIGKPIENKMVLHKYWFTYGLTMKYMKMYPAARSKIEKAMEYADNLDEEIKCMNNIALTYKLQDNYEKALKCYDDALEACGGDPYLRVFLMNNIANLHAERGNIGIAKTIITQAIFLMPQDLNINRKVHILNTYIRVEDNMEETIHQLLEMLSQSEKVTESKKALFEAVDIVLDRLMEKKKTAELMAFAEDIRAIIKEAVEMEMMVDLRARLGDIFCHFLKGGGVRLEK